MAYECFAEITYAANHVHSCDIATGMTNNAVRSSCHTFGLTALSADRDFGNGAAEVAEGPVLLGAVAKIASIDRIAWMFAQINLELLLGNGLLPHSLILCLLSGSRLPLWHVSFHQSLLRHSSQSSYQNIRCATRL